MIDLKKKSSLGIINHMVLIVHLVFQFFELKCQKIESIISIIFI